jgi:hypothetical protein
MGMRYSKIAVVVAIVNQLRGATCYKTGGDNRDAMGVVQSLFGEGWFGDINICQRARVYSRVLQGKQLPAYQFQRKLIQFSSHALIVICDKKVSVSPV